MNAFASDLKRSTPVASSKAKPLASLSLDLDNKWSYMKTHGEPGADTFPSYFDVLIPYVLDLLDLHGLKITFFVVGQDAALDRNRDYLRMLTTRGHEVGNHSFHHEPWLHLYARKQIEKEVSGAEAEIERATGQKPVGFRGPGFSWSPDLLNVLSDRGYIFDASTFPTYLGPIARFYYLSTSRLTAEEKDQRRLLFGNFKEGLRLVKPYRWQLPNGSALLELPVTTIPGIKVPFHLSYLLYLSRISLTLMLLYLKMALSLCRLTLTEPSFLLHPLDFLGADQVPELAFFPGMRASTAQKREIFRHVVRELERHFILVDMTTHAESINGSVGIPDVKCLTS